MGNAPKQFWMVYGLENRPPQHHHDSRESAVAEARRLARINPDNVFVVLEAVQAIVKREFITINYRDRMASEVYVSDDGIPF